MDNGQDMTEGQDMANRQNDKRNGVMAAIIWRNTS